MAAIWAGRAAPGRRVVALDGAAKLGAKILVSGGGRCNLTHDTVDESAYAGSSRNAIRKVLRRFDTPQTLAFFRDLGVQVKREPTGKLFPVTDRARTVLDALLNAARVAGVALAHPHRVESVRREGHGFVAGGAWGEIRAARIILATGGKSLPKSGSDGGGYALAQALGHTLTPYIFPALVPLVLPGGHFLRHLSGVAVPATLDVWSGAGKRLVGFTDSTLCTHFGLSGPSVLDISRHYTAARLEDPGATLTVNWLPGETPQSVDAALQSARHSPLRCFEGALPERLIRALCEQAGVDPGAPLSRLNRETRRALATALTRLPLPVVGDRGFQYAEVTAGGVPLSEIRLETMESRLCPGLYLCGEICDVDGRIGGYNFQWAWASGYVAGLSAGRALA
ncbi:MAG: NAD(P)/FAD-dependent oxidoreductase [Anaerolineae bacterium]|nr:NAD(P)/FAD-dependent oxidoreductase [Anaerolineae bacterium]